MKKSPLKITAICAAALMMTASAWAQSESVNQPINTPSSNPNMKSWSTKRLSATGRNNDYPVRASKLIGAQVNDSSGQRVGQIQDVILDPASGRIQFALLSLNSVASPTPTANPASATSNLIPVPWSLLHTSAASLYSGANSESPLFTLNADQNKLNGAPKVDWSDLSQSQWQQRIYAYYGVNPEPSMGGAESPQGQIKGEGAQQVGPPAPQQPSPPTP